MSNTQNITHSNLAEFYGSECVYFNPLFKAIKYTEGVKFLNRNGAGWLVDAILSHGIHNRKVRGQEFVVVTLKVDLSNKTARLIFSDGNLSNISGTPAADFTEQNKHVLAIQDFDYTDFPLVEISFYLENGILMLPSER